jgi:hypothetical protein
MDSGTQHCSHLHCREEGFTVINIIKDFVIPNSIGEAVIYIFIILLIILFIKSKGKWAIGPISFDPQIGADFKDFMRMSIENDELHTKALNGINIRLDHLEKQQNEEADNVNRLRRESIKTQILLNETSFERKCYLYDEYKKLGGNGWMSGWFEQYKADFERQQMKERT